MYLSRLFAFLNPATMRSGPAAPTARISISWFRAAGGGLILILLFASFAPLTASYYRAGKRAFSNRQYAKAHGFFRKALRSNPRNGNPLFYIGYMLEKQGRPREAVTAYKRAVRLRMTRDLKTKTYWKIVLHYKYYRDWANLAVYSRRFLRYRRFDQVKELLELAEKNLDPASRRASELTTRAEALLRKRDYTAAKPLYAEIIRLKPKNQQARWTLARILMREREYADADAQLRRLIRYNRSLWQYHYKAGICKYQVGEMERALRDFANANRLNKDPSDSFKYFIAYRRALVHLESGNFRGAKRLLDRAHRSKKTAGSLGALALAELGLGRATPAGKFAARALRMKPSNHSALVARSVLLSRYKRPGARNVALNLLKSVEEDKGGRRHLRYRFLAFYYLGLDAAGKGERALALRALARVEPEQLKSEPFRRLAGAKEETDLHRDYSIVLARTLNSGEPTPAELEQAGRLLNRLGDSAPALYEQARLAARSSQVEKTRALLTRAAAAAPEDRRESLWKKAWADPLFRALAERDENFRDYLRNRGKAPAQPPKKTEPEPAPAKTEPAKTEPAKSEPVKKAPTPDKPAPAAVP